MKKNVYDRPTLYREVWNDPMNAVAKRYGISDTMLKKICRQLNIPTPPRGYWAKLRAGAKIKTPKLPAASQCSKIYGVGMDEIEMDEKERAKTNQGCEHEYLEQLKPQQADFIYSIAAGIEYKPNIRIRESLKELKLSGDFSSEVRRVNSPQYYLLDNEVSKSQIGRVLSIAESIGRGIEQLGGRMAGGLSVEAFGEEVELRFYEGSKKEAHTITSAEQKALHEYEANKHYWGKPNIRKWDYRFNGLLKLDIIGNHRYSYAAWGKPNRSFSETTAIPLNARIDEIIIAICDVLIQNRFGRLDEEKQFREEQERVKAAQVHIDAYNAEVDRFETALRESELFFAADRLRKYSARLRSGDDSRACEYANWVDAKANWIDPTIDFDDGFFGAGPQGELVPRKKPAAEMSYSFRNENKLEKEFTEANIAWEEFVDLVDGRRWPKDASRENGAEMPE